ncbi:MAG: hypothetical protein AXW15_00135 [Neptuniibacter sp. Phe_28]|nr:MAG: hypothetical protein AXW15_00135 [Neptuniibacter sp. Phe_28]
MGTRKNERWNVETRWERLHYHAGRWYEEQSVKARRYAQKRSTPRWPPCSCVGAGTSLSGLVFRRGYTDGILHKLNLQLHYHAERGNEMRATAARERGAAQAWITRILSLSPIAENTQWMILSKTKKVIAEG